MAFRGNIETFFFSSLLQLLTNDRKTGVLHIEKEKDEVDIFIKEGSIVNAISSRSKNRLGYLLRTKGIITSEDLEKCLSISRENGQKLGKVLVENNHITMGDLEKFLNDQVEETIYDLFIWEKGNFEFKESEFNTDKQVVTNIDTLGIILEASRRVDEISLLKNNIPDENMVLITNADISSTDKLNEEERPVLTLITGKKTIRDIVIESGYDQHSAYKIIYSLISSGFAEVSKEIQELETDQQTEKNTSTELQLDLELIPQEEKNTSAELQLDLELIPQEEKNTSTELQLDLEQIPQEEKNTSAELQLDLELIPQEEKNTSTELQLDLEQIPQEEPLPCKKPNKEKPAEKIIVDTDIKKEITQKNGGFSSYKNKHKHEKGESTRFDPRETKSKETDIPRFVPDITLVKGTSQISNTFNPSIYFSTKKKFIGFAAITISIAVITTVFILRPDNKMTVPSTQPKNLGVIEKKPTTKKTKTGIKDKETFTLKNRKYSNNILSVSIPDGYKVTDKSNANTQKIFFKYGKDIKIQLTSWKQKEEWNPETMMYKKIEEIQKRKDGSHSLTANNYNLINVSRGKGYEIVMSGIRNYTFSRVYLCTLSCKGKMFTIDIDCKSSKDPEILNIFNTLKDSMVKSLIVN